MYLTAPQALCIILAVAVGCMITRFLPFLLFPENKKRPKVIDELSKLLPPAMMGLLVVYCLKEVDLFSGSHGIPELIAIAVTAVLHLWRRSSLLSIAAGTVTYMVLVQMVFV